AYALADQRLDVVLRNHSRTGENLQQAPRFGHGENGVDTHVVTGTHKGNTAGRAGYWQVREQRNLCSTGSASPDVDVTGIQTAHTGRRCSDTGGAADRIVAVAPAEAKLGSDIACKAASRSHHTGFDLHFLGLAIKLS